MADEDKIKYSDIIQPDDSIEKLIKQLGELNQSYETMVNAIRAGADRVVHALKTASGATNEGRKSIDEATASTSRLERAQNELKLALSDTGKQITWLKAQTSDANRATVEQQRYIQQAISSYDRLKSDLKQTVELYKSLTAAERADSEMGQQLLNDILNLKNQIKALDDQMKPHIQTLTEVQKAEQKLAYLQSEEGQKLLELKAKIAEVTAARRQQKTATDPLVQAQEKLAYARSEENQQLKLYSTQIKEANQIAQLQATIANSAEGSYNRLSAQYALNKIRLNQMSQAEREAADSGKKLEAETAAIYQQMIKLQEATGNYRLSVGHYQRTWDGLGISISQVVRELPAAAVSLNTFFLGISNNIPMVVDEINRLRAQNKLLQAEGKATVNVTKSIVRSLFGWNTALVILLTVFSMFGDEIIKFINRLRGIRIEFLTTQKAIENITEELKSSSNSYGSNIVLLRQLQEEYKNLRTEGEKVKWIENNTEKFDELGLAIDSVNKADRVFIEQTAQVVEALRLRTKAEAARNLAQQKYAEAFQKEEEALQAKRNPSEADVTRTALSMAMEYVFSPGRWTYDPYELNAQKTNVRLPYQELEEEAKAANDAAEKYFKLSETYDNASNTLLKGMGVLGNGDSTDTTTGRRRGPRDLTDIINRNDINIRKKYEESITELMQDEYAKRRKSAEDEVQTENAKLREMYRKNEEYVKNVEGKYKELTEAQKEQIEQQQKWLLITIDNNLRALEIQLERIRNEQLVGYIGNRRETMNEADTSGVTTAAHEGQPVVSYQGTITRNNDALEQSLAQERQLMEDNLDLEYALILETNRKLLAAGNEEARSEEEIFTELNKKKLQLYANYDKQILKARQTSIEDQLKLVQKGSDAELELLLEQNENARKLALAENIALPAAEQRSTSDINAEYDQQNRLIRGSFALNRFEEEQELEKARFEADEHRQQEYELFSLKQEIDRWDKMIDIAKAGGLRWSKEQTDAADQTLANLRKKYSKMTANDFFGRISQYGVGGTILSYMGFDDDSIAAFQDATNIILDNLQEIIDKNVEIAEQAVEAAEERVDAAKSAYDAEVEARNNGYANNVATAKKELELEKKNAREKQKTLEKAKRQQEAINSAMQASSLITATANLWMAYSTLPFVGKILAIAAIATMWTSFAAAKIKAQQMTALESEQTYGEGGIEFLEGGSHASGNDINLGVKNRKNKRMRAEGGEALAIINKRNTRKYKQLLPDVIDSFNKGIFEDKYMNAFSQGENISIAVNAVSKKSIDLTKVEQSLDKIYKQGEIKYYTLPNGTIVMQYKNVKRIIKN